MVARKQEKGSATRRRILEAAQRVMDRQGVARLRTHEVTAEAGCAEGTLYRHFASKEDLLLAVILDSVPHVAEATDEQLAGTATIEANLRALLRAVLHHEERMVPLALAVLADQALHTRFREAMTAAGGGPQRLRDQLSRYIAAEQRLGRVPSHLDPPATAAMIQGSCFQHALFKRLHGDELFPETPDQLVTGVVASLVGSDHG